MGRDARVGVEDGQVGGLALLASSVSPPGLGLQDVHGGLGVYLRLWQEEHVGRALDVGPCGAPGQRSLEELFLTPLYWLRV